MLRRRPQGFPIRIFAMGQQHQVLSVDLLKVLLFWSALFEWSFRVGTPRGVMVVSSTERRVLEK